MVFSWYTLSFINQNLTNCTIKRKNGGLKNHPVYNIIVGVKIDKNSNVVAKKTV